MLVNWERSTEPGGCIGFMDTPLPARFFQSYEILGGGLMDVEWSIDDMLLTRGAMHTEFGDIEDWEPFLADNVPNPGLFEPLACIR